MDTHESLYITENSKRKMFNLSTGLLFLSMPFLDNKRTARHQGKFGNSLVPPIICYSPYQDFPNRRTNILHLSINNTRNELLANLALNLKPTKDKFSRLQQSEF